jgi:4-carboxymuconolactone decarboxylase
MRLPDLDEATLTPEQREVYERIKSGPRGVVVGPLQVWLTSPALAQRAQELGAFCRYHTSFPPRLSELAILVTGAHWRAGFEWATHAPIGLQAGLQPTLVEAVRQGTRPEGMTDEEAAVHDFAVELQQAKFVSAETFSRAERVLGRPALVELVGILGYYTLISMTINAFEVPLPPGAEDPFPEGKP